MPLFQLKISQFRNISQINCDLAEGLNVFEGDNAQGKTNLLEAVYLLVNGKSFRVNEFATLIRSGQEQAHLEALLRHEDLESSVQTLLNPRGRETRFQGKPLKTLSEIHRQVRVLVFTPDSSSLFRGSPTLRRRYFDHAAGVHRATYSGKLSRYLRVLKQRNRLLETGQAGALWEEFTRAWAEEALVLMREREAYLLELVPHWRRRLAQMMPEASELDASWEGSLARAGVSELGPCLEYLNRHRDLEFRVRRCVAGPHRDDLTLRLKNNLVRDFASQGQQRMVVIALKLAEADLFLEARGRSPVFLLDDLGSELDPTHLSRLLETLNEIKAQTLLTTAQPKGFVGLRSRTYRIHEGSLHFTG